MIDYGKQVHKVCSVFQQGTHNCAIIVVLLLQDGGHQFTIKGELVPLAGTIVLVSGDSLGSQLIVGFKEGPGAHLKCRHCMGSAKAINCKV